MWAGASPQTHLGVLLSEVLVEHDAQVAHERLLVARLHHDGDARDQVGRLLPDLGELVVQPPLDRAADLREVQLDAHAERVDDRAEAVEHDGRVVLHAREARTQSSGLRGGAKIARGGAGWDRSLRSRRFVRAR
jgi:hypothetical protein